jgi:hypothetical protein
MNNIYRKFRVAVINTSLPKPYWSYGDHWVDGFKDAGCEVKVFKYEEIAHIPPNFDLYFFVEVRYNPSTIPWYIYPRVVYSWDSHVAGLQSYRPLVNHFDKILLASKIDTEALNAEHPDKFAWIPEACNPRVHKNLNQERTNNLGYIGHPNGNIVRSGYSKSDFLKHLKEKHGLVHSMEIYGPEYTKGINKIKVMFDRTIGHNIGTRIFEAGSAGCCTLWSKTGHKHGIEELLEEKVHYIAYDDTIESFEEVFGSLTEEKIKNVTEEAQSHILSNHTYAHRVKQILEVMGFDNIINFSEK